ncbi:MAG: hypothetical protein WBS17_05400 [Candidatus Acidiferrales bacterium]
MPALTARRLEHLATAAAACGLRLARFAHRSAIRATGGLIGKALHREEFLFAGRKCELASAINTTERFISVHERVSYLFYLS